MLRGIGTFLLFLTLTFFPEKALGQSSLAEFDVVYNSTYQLQKSYTIMHDNSSASTKLNNLRIEFFSPSSKKVGEVTISHPIDGSEIIHDLENPIIGFERIKLHILSLHSGSVSDLPSNMSSILALSLDDVIPDEPVNAPPKANEASFRIEAGTERVFNLRNYYDDPDNDQVLVLPMSGQKNGLSYNLTSDGELTLTAPDVLEAYVLTYQIRDSREGAASSRIKISVAVPEALLGNLEREKTRLERLEVETLETEEALALTNADNAQLHDLIRQLSMDNQLLSESAAGIFYTSVKSDIDALTEEINSDLEIAADETNKSSLENVKTLLGEQQENYTQIIAYSQTEGTNIADLKSRLDELSLVSSALQADLEKLESRPMLSQEQLSAWQNQHQKLTKTLRQRSTYVRYTLMGLVILVLGGIAGTLAIYLNSIGKNKNGAIEPGFSTVKTFSRKDLKADNNKTAIADDNEKYGMAFSGSSSITIASENLSKPDLQIGRIGQRMGLVPIEEDFSLGTGILISERHVLTNLHVYTDNKQYLIADFLAKLGYLEHGELCWGIELEAFESSGGHTNFRAFDGAPPVPLEGFDLAIFRLAKPFTEFRETEEFLERPRPEIDDLIGRKIRVDGYPDWPDFSNDELRRSEQLAAYGHVKSFAVRQSSKGSVFVPKDFTNSVLTYDHQLLGPIPVICHNASTLPGCSGAPVYDDESGELLGIHFRGLQKFGGEQANLAMPIGPILEALEGIDFGL